MRWIYHVIPVPVATTSRLISDRFSALSLGVAIFIRPAQRDNEALIAHELTHCRQFYRSLGVNALRYWLSKDYRYRAELEAWRVHIRINPDARDRAIEMLSCAYGVDVSREQVERDL